MKDFEHSSLQTWPAPIVVGEPEYVTRLARNTASRTKQLVPVEPIRMLGKLPGGQTPYPNYNVRMAAMPMHEDYLRISPELAETAGS